MGDAWVLGIEVSNPSIASDDGATGRFGPSVALGRRSGAGSDAPVAADAVAWLDAGARADDGLMPAIDALCAGQGVAPGAIGEVAVSIGPGGFTGLRVAVTAARCLALATGARPLPVGSHAVAMASVWDQARSALGATGGRGPVGVGLASKGDAVCVAWLEPELLDGAIGPEAMRRLDAVAVVGPEALGAAKPAVFVGDGHLPASVRAALGATPVIVPRLSAPALLGLVPLASGLDADRGSDGASSMGPRYVREPEAVRIWRERRG